MNASARARWLNIHADTPREVLATAYFAQSSALVASMARVLGRTDEAAKYGQLAGDVRAAFQKAFVRGNGLGFRIKGDTQTGYLLALRFDLLEPAQVPWAVDRLVDDIVFARKNHLSIGFLGVGLISPVLSAFGHADLGYKLLLNETFPSWGFSRIPAKPEQTATEAGQPLERADGVSAVYRDAKAVVLELGSGNYRFSVR